MCRKGSHTFFLSYISDIVRWESILIFQVSIKSYPTHARYFSDSWFSKYNIADGMRQMFDPFERVARAHHICPCCERPFTPNEEDDFVSKVCGFYTAGCILLLIFWFTYHYLASLDYENSYFFHCSTYQQRVKSASSAEHMKVLAVESSNADSHFQQLDKLRMIYEEYVKLGKENIPLAEKNLQELMEDLNQKSQAYDDVMLISFLISLNLCTALFFFIGTVSFYFCYRKWLTSF